MKFLEGAGRGVQLIRGYSGTTVTVGDTVLDRPFILGPQALVADWAVGRLATLAETDLEPLWPLAPQVVLLGSGDRQRFPSPALRQAFARRNVALEAMDLGAACRTYNVLVQEDRAVAALLFPESAA